MAIEGNKENRGPGIPALACTVPYLLGMVLIYTGERLVGTPVRARLIVDGLGAACILWAVVARTIGWTRSREDRRSVEGMILLAYLGGLFALILYAAGLPQVRLRVFPWIEGARAVSRYETILSVLWPIAWISSVLPLLFMEISYASMARAPRVERRRVAFSAASGLTIAWLLAGLFLLNYAASARNHRWDLSFQRTASPSEAARRLVSNLNEPFEVFLFYPEVNEVLDELTGYFQDLARRSGWFRVRVYDQVMEPKRAEELGARQNGTIVYRYGDRKEVVRVGLKLAEARRKLSDLDQEFQQRFLRLVAEKRVAYFTTGHGERPYDWRAAKDPRSPVKALKKILRKQNFEVKALGLGQGLASAVPDDASMLLVIDPTEDFLPEELDAIRRYLQAGGRMWVALDPDHETNLSRLLEDYGVRYHRGPLANARYFVRTHYTPADRYNLFTNRPSSHPSVTTLSRNASRMAVVLLGSGYLERLKEQKDAAKVVVTLRSMSGTWADTNRNMEQDASEEKKTYDLGAAITVQTGSGEPRPGSSSSQEEQGSAPTGKTSGGAPEESRILVLADADALSDQVIGNLGNYFLFDDGLKWLFEEEGDLLGTVKSEEDVRIMHTRQEDVVWFYSTIFAVPLAVLGIGILYNRLRVKPSRRAKKA